MTLYTALRIARHIKRSEYEKWSRYPGFSLTVATALARVPDSIEPKKLLDQANELGWTGEMVAATVREAWLAKPRGPGRAVVAPSTLSQGLAAIKKATQACVKALDACFAGERDILSQVNTTDGYPPSTLRTMRELFDLAKAAADRLNRTAGRLGDLLMSIDEAVGDEVVVPQVTVRAARELA